jgi:hypothetical protein
MKILRKKGEYTDDDISEFQELIDNFSYHILVIGGRKRGGHKLHSHACEWACEALHDDASKLI